ncbi:GntR family transcriptional regulator [Tianweitania populi]|uniref:GntR family transcriptional regulator n=1 Tax=Tianweitania populi TaxID=1607949 RepID=UPI00167378A1|nr:GntR family transcriptional regulator [Tianweitania populi]
MNAPASPPSSAHRLSPATLPSRHSIGEDVYGALLSDLIALRIPPGERMSVDALARHFGVSQTPVRAALIRLEAEGLVAKKFNSGYSAAPMPSGAYFRDTYAMRRLIEPEAAALSAGRMTSAQKKDLARLCSEMEALTKGDTLANYGRFAQLDGQFHALIAGACGNAIIAETLERLYAHMHLFRLRHHTAVAEEAVKEHLLISQAIADGDVEHARSAMQAHIDASCQRMEPFFRVLA